MHAQTQTPGILFYMPDGVMWLFIDLLGVEMHTNTFVHVFAGRGRGGGWDGQPRLRLTLAVA